MTILVFAGVLSVPSAVFAEATWYGSLRGGLEFGGGSDARFYDGFSRWGVRGSNEAGEGITAVYRFEHKLSTTNAGLDGGGRLAFVGISGGFGSLTLGQIWSASYNTAGAITDPSTYFGNSTTSYRHGSALSWAYSTDVASFQVDLISDGGKATGNDVDKAEFGVSFNMGDIGTIALAHTTVEDTMKTQAVSFWVNDASGDPTTTEAQRIMVTYAKDENVSNVNNGQLTTDGLALIRFDGTKYRIDTADDMCGTAGDDTDACKTTIAYVSTAITRAPGDEANTVVHETFYLAGGVTRTPAMSVVDAAGSKSNHIAVSFNVGGLTPWLGHSQKSVNGMMGKTRTAHYGLRGALGDTGLNFVVSGRNEKDADGMKKNPWYAEFTKSLGGGALVYLGHQNNDDGKSGRSRIGLHVGF